MATADTRIIESLQNAVVKWINTLGEVSYLKLHRGFKRLVEKECTGEPEKINSFFYEAVFPLVKLGIIEYGIRDGNETVFYTPLDRTSTDSCEAYKDGLNLLKYLPSMSAYVKTLEECPPGMRVNYRLSLKDYRRRPVTDSLREVGLYKQKDYDFYPYYLMDCNGILRKVKRRENSFECFDYASAFIHINSGKDVYSYDAVGKNLTVFSLDYMPPFIVRALCLIDYEHFVNVRTFTDKRIVFRNVDEKVIKELERIFKKG